MNCVKCVYEQYKDDPTTTWHDGTQSIYHQTIHIIDNGLWYSLLCLSSRFALLFAVGPSTRIMLSMLSSTAHAMVLAQSLWSFGKLTLVSLSLLKILLDRIVIFSTMFLCYSFWSLSPCSILSKPRYKCGSGFRNACFLSLTCHRGYDPLVRSALFVDSLHKPNRKHRSLVHY